MNAFLQKFVQKVYRMRQAQKLLKEVNTRSAIAVAEGLEVSVDKMLEEIGVESIKARQLGLEETEPRKTDESPGEYLIT